MTRQRQYQLKLKAAGKCILCAQPRNLYAVLCDKHQARTRDREREKHRQARGEALALHLVGKAGRPRKTEAK